VARFDQRDGTLLVRTYREGLAARAGHDLVLAVTRWRATLDDGTLELTADPRSLEVREALHGIAPLTERDRDAIQRNIDEKVLRGAPIAFRAAGVRIPAGPASFEVAGELALAGATRPLAVALDVAADGRVSGTATVVQSDWGIKPYRGLMGALKLRDAVEVAVDVQPEDSR
jgi:hypothetical protein